MATLLSSLPLPTHSATVESDEEDNVAEQTEQLSLSKAPVAGPSIPPLWLTKGLEAQEPRRVSVFFYAFEVFGADDGEWLNSFGDGGAYPECAIAQYPVEMGRKKHASSGNTLALTVDSDGKVDYSKIATQGHREGRHVQSQFKDLIPLAHRTDISATERDMDRPSEEEVQATADRTRAALEKLTNGKIKAAQPKNVPDLGGAVSYVRYTPNASGSGGAAAGSQRIIKMVEVVEDPLEPPRFKGKKIPRGPPSPPAPVLRSPPRKVTAQEQKEWQIPPCISNWKNNKGYTIPLDKRLAADGRGLQDVHINDRFAQFSEALYVADRHAREEVRQRSLMQQRIAQKEKEQKEENLRLLAQRAREERSGITAPSGATRVSGAAGGSMPAALAGYGSDSDADSKADTDAGSEDEDEGDGANDPAARARDEQRKERRRDRERELRMNNMGNEKKAQMLARSQNRDIGEKIALGLAKPTMSKESMLDSRLFNQESYSGAFADDDSYAAFDKPLFSGAAVGQAIYKAGMTAGGAGDDDEKYGGGTEDGIGKQMRNDRFGLGVAGRGFEGADLQETREGPVQFERDTADPFAIDAFLDEAKKGSKRGLDKGGDHGEGGSGKRRKE